MARIFEGLGNTESILLVCPRHFHSRPQRGSGWVGKSIAVPSQNVAVLRTSQVLRTVVLKDAPRPLREDR